MKVRNSLHILIVFALASLGGCVSVEVVPKADRRSANAVQFSAPAAPFAKMEHSGSDTAWQNPLTGSSISYQSDCSETIDPSLEVMFETMTRGLRGLEIKSRETLTYNGRAAIRYTFVSQVDGVAVKISTLHFKKNNCTYVLSLVSTVPEFDKDLGAFDSFVREFKAP